MPNRNRFEASSAYCGRLSARLREKATISHDVIMAGEMRDKPTESESGKPQKVKPEEEPAASMVASGRLAFA